MPFLGQNQKVGKNKRCFLASLRLHFVSCIESRFKEITLERISSPRHPFSRNEDWPHHELVGTSLSEGLCFFFQNQNNNPHFFIDPMMTRLHFLEYCLISISAMLQLDFTCISSCHNKSNLRDYTLTEVFFTSQSGLFTSARRTHQKEGAAPKRQTFLDV